MTRAETYSNNFSCPTSDEATGSSLDACSHGSSICRPVLDTKQTFRQVFEAWLKEPKKLHHDSSPHSPGLRQNQMAFGLYPTERQLQILELLAHGDTAGEVATKLGLSPKSVEKQRHVLSVKLGASNTTHMVALALCFDILNRFDGTFRRYEEWRLRRLDITKKSP